MARKSKAKPMGRTPLPRGTQREQQSIRLPPPLWRRIEALGKRAEVIEQGMTEWLDRHHNQGDKHG